MAKGDLSGAGELYKQTLEKEKTGKFNSEKAREDLIKSIETMMGKISLAERKSIEKNTLKNNTQKEVEKKDKVSLPFEERITKISNQFSVNKPEMRDAAEKIENELIKNLEKIYKKEKNLQKSIDDLIEKRNAVFTNKKDINNEYTTSVGELQNKLLGSESRKKDEYVLALSALDDDIKNLPNMVAKANTKNASIPEIHNEIKELKQNHPELESLDKKLDKGSRVNLSQNQLNDIATSLEIIKLGKDTDIQKKVNYVRQTINSGLPKTRKISSKINKVIKPARKGLAGLLGSAKEQFGKLTDKLSNKKEEVRENIQTAKTERKTERANRKITNSLASQDLQGANDIKQEVIDNLKNNKQPSTKIAKRKRKNTIKKLENSMLSKEEKLEKFKEKAQNNAKKVAQPVRNAVNKIKGNRER